MKKKKLSRLTKQKKMSKEDHFTRLLQNPQ